MKSRSLHTLILFTLCLLSANLLSAQSTRYYLNIDGTAIKGSAVEAGFEEQIEVLSYGLSVSNDAQLVPGSGIVNQDSRVDGFEFLIQGDIKALPPLFQRTNVGGGAPEGRLTLMTLTGVFGVSEERYTPIVIELENCIVASISLEGANGDLPVYSLQVAFEKITITTIFLDDSGNPSSDVSTTWDYDNNVPF